MTARVVDPGGLYAEQSFTITVANAASAAADHLDAGNERAGGRGLRLRRQRQRCRTATR